MRAMAACVCVLGLWSVPSAAQASPDLVDVRVHASFDRSISSATVTSALADEASAIWRDYGVRLHWTDDGAPAVLDLDVDFVRHEKTRMSDHSWSVLGRTTLDPAGRVRGPVVVLIDSVELLLDEAAVHAGNVVVRQQDLGRALGRVLAHELGHVLLGTSHDVDGLMRRSFLPEDLIRRDRGRFQLAGPGVARLNACVARFTAGADADR